MVRTSLKVIAVDAVLLIGAYFVLQDLQWRSGYASQGGFSPSYFYSILTQSFIMTGRGLSLQSPPTLDWVQVLVLALVALNAWYLFRLLGPDRQGTKASAKADPENLAAPQSAD